MPTYDYACSACGHELEIFHSITDKPKRRCPECGKPKLERRISAGAGFLFKGAGFYQTDYRSDSYRAGEKAESGDTQSASDASSTTTPEASKETGKDAAKSSDAKSEASKPAAKETKAAESAPNSTASEKKSSKKSS